MRTRLWKLNALWKLNVCLGAGLICGCKGGQTTLPYTVTTGGSPDQGKATIVAYRCGECHTIPGVPDAKGVFLVLPDVALSTYLYWRKLSEHP